MKIIIIGQTDYKEKDLIINAISEEGPVSFKVRGGLNPTSPFAWLRNPLIEADVEYVENVRYKHQILKGATLVSNSLTNNPNLDYMQAIGLALEIINKMFQEDEKHLLFFEIEKYIDAIKKIKNYAMAELILIAKAIKESGYSFEVNQCIYCGNTKRIVSFSFSEGGFICADCMDEQTPIDLNASQMRIIRYIFNTDKYDQIDKDSLPVDDIKILFTKLNEFIYENIGAKIEAIPNIIKSL